MKKIAVFLKVDDPLNQKMIDVAKQYGYQVEFYPNQHDFEPDDEVEILFATNAGLIEKCKNLKWMALFSAGVPAAVLEKLPAECFLTNSSGAYGLTLAEHMVMQTLMIIRGMPVYFESSVKHEWHKPVPQISIKDARVTVLGAGDIGTNYAKRVRSFEPKQIIAVNRSGVSKEEVYDEVYPISKLEEVLPDTDILAMSLPGTPATKNIINEHTLSLMPKGSYIINVGRGNSVDEKALMEALNNNHLAGAALDVFETEPLPADSSLWTTKNLIITPHVAGNQTVQYTREKIVDMFCENIENITLNKPLKYTVNRKLGY